MFDKIALLGANGYIGESFKELLKSKRVNFTSITRKECDLLDKDKLSILVKELKPSAIINCAGYTGFPNVDACETNKQECEDRNYKIPLNISEISNDLNIRWIHVSSGCIYDGDNNGKGFSEQDEPNFCFESLPCSYYSGVKANAEKMLRKDKNVYICRLRIPFNQFEHHKNYITKLLKYDKIFNAVNSLSNTNEFVEACFYLLEKQCDTGIYNLTNTGSVETKFVIKLLNKYLTSKEFVFFDNEKDFYSTAAQTPRSNCVLDNTKILNAGFKMKHIVEALEESVMKYEIN